MNKIEGSSGTHSYSHAEKRGYCDFINGELSDDPDLQDDLPMDTQSDDLFKVIAKGVLIAKLINKSFEDTVDESKMVKKAKNQFEVKINHDMCIQGAKDIGCSVVNIGGSDLCEGTPHLVLGLLWQVIKTCLMSQMALTEDLARLMAAEESLSSLPPEQILLRWFNYHLKNAGHHRTVANFTTDLQDAENYAVLLAQIAPDKVSAADLEKAFRERDFLKRAELVLELADRLGCRKFVTAQDIVDGNPKLNLAFVATLFKNYPSLGKTAEEMAKERANELEERVDELESLLAETMIEKDEMKGKYDDTLLELTELSDEVKDLEAQLKDALDGNEKLATEKATLEDLVGSLEGEKAELESLLADVSSEKDDLFAQLEAEVNLKLDVQRELADTQAELADTKQKAADEIAGLKSRLDEEMGLKDDFQRRLDDALAELERTKEESAAREADLAAQLAAERETNARLTSELDERTKQLAESQATVADLEQTKAELFNLLTDTLTELETTKANAKAMEEDLRAQLAEERAAKEELQQRLDATLAEYEQARADWEEERARLLARIAELEKEVEDLKNEMRMKLEAAEKSKEEALAKAAAALERALSDAANEKDQAMDKMRLLLSGNQKQGYLWKQETGLMGLQWKKKFFVLRDNLLCWYNNEKISEKTKPKGIIYCEECRLYELDSGEAKRDFVFQIDNQKTRTNIGADSIEEMKEWMTEIRVAKKKKLGGKAVSEETSAK